MSQRKQGTISSFFPPSPTKPSGKKRQAETIDLTTPSPPSKRSRGSDSVRTESPYFSRVEAASVTYQRQPRILENYGYSTEKFTEPRPRTAAQEERHEAFKKRLLVDNTLLLPTGEATQIEQEDQNLGVHAEDRSVKVSDPEPEGDSSDKFHNLQQKFANEGTQALKGTIAKKRARNPKKAVEIGPSGLEYTPLELQVRRLKQENPGSVLMFEVGYKYKFYDNDATVAAKELGMVAFPDRNFQVASIPVHRRDVYLKKLLSQGYRVGIVSQTETAALKKAGKNKGGLFERELVALYTDGTFVDEINSVDDLERQTPPPVLCVVEEWNEKRPELSFFGIISICPSTGDVIWDDFEDKAMRIELETRLSHLQPAEILKSSNGLSEPTARMLSNFAGTSTSGNAIRHEQFEDTLSYDDAFEFVSEFYSDKTKLGAASENFRSGRLMAEVAAFPKRVVVALAHAIRYMSSYGIADAFLETQFFTKFTTRAHMLLAANTLTNLEIYQNETDGSVRGSLIWILDRTKTRFGARLLRNWVGRPLVEKRILVERVSAVQEILQSSSDKLLTLREILKGLPDLAKGLSRIQYGQCKPEELAILLPSFNKIATAFDGEVFTNLEDVGFQSTLLNEIVFSLPKLKEPMRGILAEVNLQKASEGKKDSLWNNPERYPDIIDAEMALQTIEFELGQELKKIRKQINFHSLEWTSHLTDECLVEVLRSHNRKIPDTWILHSSTRKVQRYQTPEVLAKLDERAQYRERLMAAANAAFKSFLREIASNHYGILRDAVNKLAIADCLCSLAQVAFKGGYVRPEFVDEDVFDIVEARHPMTEETLAAPYIPNSVYMGGDRPRSKIITGPNMGGKSSCVRAIALIAVMAQIGSYVPASSVRMKLLDSVLTRMGASDDIMRGKSTFMVEMSETREILNTATDRSLVILDELGRGTSTFDGMAIADAVLHHLVETKKSKTLFITHYPMVATRLEAHFPKDVENLHMKYTTDVRLDKTRTITFLYKLTSGLAPESFGIECGRLAGLPENLLQIASDRSDQLCREVDQRIERNRIRKALKLVNQIPSSVDSDKQAVDSKLADLVSLAQAITAVKL